MAAQYNSSLVAQTEGGGVRDSQGVGWWGGGVGRVKPFKKCFNTDVAGACKVLDAEGECSKSDFTRLHRCNLLHFLNERAIVNARGGPGGRATGPQ